MVSVIIPIYNVEKFLKQCIESILNQTYTNFEMILVDDGSTDQSRSIAESYKDSRIRFFHTANHGLSAARNYGIEMAHGEFLMFVDSDDWIESNLLEQLIATIGEADILCFGNTDSNYDTRIYTKDDALTALVNQKLPNTIWSMIYRKKCFKSIRFPYGRVYEDIATTHKLLLEANYIVSTNIKGYHYRYREDSISHKLSLQNLCDLWLAHKERYIDCRLLVDKETLNVLLDNCAYYAVFAFAWKNSFSKYIPSTYYEIASFVKENYKPFISCHCPFKIRVGLVFVQYPAPLSFWVANRILVFSRRILGKTNNGHKPYIASI